MAIYKVLPVSGKGSCLADRGVGYPKSYAQARRLADLGREQTGVNYRVVRTETVYTTQTIEEAING